MSETIFGILFMNSPSDRHDFYCDKLMRTGTIKELEAQGATVDHVVLSQEQRISYVMKKMVEEAQEAQEAFQRQDDITLRKELADLKEAFETFLSLANIPLCEIEKIENHKKETLGTYKDALGVHKVSMSSNHPQYHHYKEDHDQYKEAHNIS